MFENMDISNIWTGNGLMITLVGYVIVFIALVLLMFIISNLKNILTINQRKKLKKSGHKEADAKSLDYSGEINAAIATAIYLHYAEAHDFENTVLTIKKVQRTYSPWSSKLYGLRQYPKKIR